VNSFLLKCGLATVIVHLFGCIGDAQTKSDPLPKFVSVPLIAASADKASKKLREEYGKVPGFRCTFEQESNTVHMQADVETIKKAKAFLEKYDARFRGSGYLKIVHLYHSDATETAQTVKTVLVMTGMLTEDHQIHVTADKASNSLIIYAGRTQMETACIFAQALDARPSRPITTTKP